MICKWNEENKITFEVSEITKPMVQGAITTKFSIYDFIKGQRDSRKKYRVTVFADIKLESGDRVKIMDFDQLVTSQDPKTKKFMQFISAIVVVVKKDTVRDKDADVVSPYE
jgi:hypothetical protein